MRNTVSVLVAGSERSAIEALSNQVSGRLYSSSIRHINNGHADPLYSVRALPDVLILHLGKGWQAMLEALAQRPASARPRTLVIGQDGDLESMRLAMRAGASDFLVAPVSDEELHTILTRFREEVDAAAGTPTTWTLVMNTKGGSGTTFLASNLAHMMAETGKDNVALVDLNIQFGTLASYFDIQPKRTLLDAIESVHELDGVALTGYMEKVNKRLHVLAAAADRLALPEDVPQKSLDLLFELIAGTYRHVVVDAPRQLNHITASAIERADNVVLVMQQSVACLHETVRMSSILQSELGVADERISVVVNRYQKNLAVNASHIEKSLKTTKVNYVPNDFRQVMESVDVGSPMYNHARASHVTKSLLKIQSAFTGETKTHRFGRFGKSLAGLLRV